MNMYRKNLADARQSQIDLEAYHEKHGDLFDILLDGMSGVVNVTPYSFDLTVSIAGDKHTLEAAWGRLRQAGFSAPTSRPKENDPTWAGRFEHKSGAVFYMSFTSSLCRRVKIGTKTVEQDVYETVCGERGENHGQVSA